jgi:hypothetical protein
MKELAASANGEFYTGFAGSPNSVKFTEEEFQKFAELIVQECIDVLYQRGWEDASSDIKKYFGGVE